MKKIPKRYNAHQVESKWLDEWDDSLYYFDLNSGKNPYLIDTPPPYPTGDFHIGNAFNFCYIDFVARYTRMRGYEVMFPQGWDCHGLPTEVKVEETHDIKKSELRREDFREMCRKLTEQNIAKMRQTMRKLGFSIDWSNEYVTMDPSFYKKTQISFVRMYEKGLIYKAEHPVNWCPRCETAISGAEVEYESKESTLYYVNFGEVNIATTRPELIAACVAVAVHPDDERFVDKIGGNVEIPIFKRRVPVIADPNVDPEFGTGVVMICTFGDKQDVRWWKRHKLPLIRAISHDGKMTKATGPYEGMSVTECGEQIVTDLKKKGLLYDEAKIQQKVGICWRCETPIEILSEHQWFIKIDADRIIEESSKIDWIPEHMFLRLEDWALSLDWDWCISRQRVFGTPVPVWYCSFCGKPMVAEADWLPVDPTSEKPPRKCECGSSSFKGESDVLDTWMDSSISALHISGWPSSAFRKAQIRPQGHDIIRTWAFYSILRSLALVNELPWESILINGIVLGADGHKMSKSRGNIVAPETVLDEYGADAFRQWTAMAGNPGSDVIFRWEDLKSATRFLQKLWSILRFSAPHMSDEPPKNFYVIDKWLLTKLQRVIGATTEHMEKFRFGDAMKEVRRFSWHILADNYIELAKARLYGSDDDRKQSARYTLYITIGALAKLLAPIIPFFAEEMYSFVSRESVHKQDWPEPNEDLTYLDAEKEGDMIKDISGAVRRYKSDRGIPLNAPLDKIEICAENIETEDIEVVANARVCLTDEPTDKETYMIEVNNVQVAIYRD